MTNNIDAITTMTNAKHGTFKVRTAHLDAVVDLWSARPLREVHNRITSEVGVELDYTDLTLIEALVVLSYLTGGCAD